MSDLAIFGGKPAVSATLQPYPAIGAAEKAEVNKVLDSGSLSAFYGNWGPQFLGGPTVRAFEEAWCRRFQVPHAVSVNSATSGLYAAMGAIGISPGDEVIVPPYTMSATAMAPLIYGGIPVFADIEPETFCLSLDSVRAALSPRTKAILAVNLFGHPAPLAALRALADQHGIALIEDNAQGPLASENGRFAGTIGHIGVFSLNYHKHIHTGEGGMCVTNDADLGLRLRAIRNHAENAVEGMGATDLTNLVGFNYRMTEMEAAVGLAQLAQADVHVQRRQDVADALSAGITGLTGIKAPVVRAGCRHVYYVWAVRYDADAVAVSRETFVKALEAEGFPIGSGYVRPLYLLPLFQKRTAFGRDGYPFNLTDRTYAKGMCPVVERMHERELLGFDTCAHLHDEHTVAQLVAAFRKVHALRRELHRLDGSRAA